MISFSLRRLNCTKLINWHSHKVGHADRIRLGLGASESLNGSDEIPSTHKSLHAEDKLRKRLLLKTSSKNRTRGNTVPSSRSNGLLPIKPKPHGRRAESESEEDSGRTALKGGLDKRPTSASNVERLAPDLAHAISKNDLVDEQGSIPHPVPSKKRASSYLDEMLRVRSEKQKKKQKTRSIRNDTKVAAPNEGPFT
jgi:hypothetical protein